MTIRVGILGCASIARRSLAPAFVGHESFQLVAVASRTAAKAEEMAAAHGARACTYDELVGAADVDLVYCPLPNGLHYEWVWKLLENGKHVLCEKSLACSPAQVRSLVALARRRRLLLMESFQFRFHAQNLFVKRLLAEGAIGRLQGMTARFSFPKLADKDNIRYDPRLGGGALLDTGAYAIKATTYILGRDVKVASATSSRDEDWAVDKDGELVLRRDDGIESEASYSMDADYRCGYVIRGSHGEIATTRAFTARADFDAEVTVTDATGTRTHRFRDDHFARLLDHIAQTLATGDFTEEYEEDLVQARLVGEAASLLGLDFVRRRALFGANGYLGTQLATACRLADEACDLYDLPSADITDAAFWETFDPARYSSILFFAGLTGTARSNANRELYEKVNVEGLARFLARLEPLGAAAPKVIYPSSRLVYRGTDLPLTEDAPKEAKTVYAENKLTCERMLEEAGARWGLRYAVLRICVPYGMLAPSERSYGTLGFMIGQAREKGRIVVYGDGSQRRTFTHVSDVCRIVRRLADGPWTGIFNMGGCDRSIRDVAELVAARMGATVALEPWPAEALALESGSTVFDSSRLDGETANAGYRQIEESLDF